ncbi:MAG: hypothetical protein H6732_15965 [Alphaproteobacteria bacterium]|nr:hypothetical protein [Alphaproteobacteria bacterium]
MDPYLASLLPLATLDDRLATLKDQLRHVARKQAALDAACTEAQARLAAAEARLAELRADERKHTDEIRRLEALRDQARSALAQGFGSAEAAERQIARCDALLDEHETAALEDMEARDEVGAERTAAQAALAEAEARRAADGPGLDAQHTRLADEQARLEVDRGSRVRALPREVQGTYTGLHTQRGGTALAVLEGDACTACRHVVPYQLRNDLKQGRLVTCDGCGRWLFLRSQAEAVTA